MMPRDYLMAAPRIFLIPYDQSTIASREKITYDQSAIVSRKKAL